MRERAMKQLAMLSRIPQPAYGITKKLLRNDDMRKLDENRAADIATFVQLIEKPIVQKSIEMYLKMLKAKKK